tara:strand:- start:875 stop:1936 length:1062 start_codon:yes stop_codon:yes gene_type:complete
MRGRNLYSLPKLFIGGKRISEFSSVSINFPGNNQINTLNVTIEDPEYQDAHLFNSKVVFYLGEGVAEGSPIFVGYVKEMNPSDTKISITAYDPRIFISGAEAEPVAITDKNNFDGYTAVQFLSSIIKEKVNLTSTIIDISALSDFSPETPMKGFRTTGQAPYEIFLNVMAKTADIDTPEDPLEYFITMEGNKLILGKKKSVQDSRSLILSYMDGIKSITYQHRAPATTAIGIGGGEDGAYGAFTYGNAPMGRVGMTFSSDKKENAEIYEEAITTIMKNYVEQKQISVQTSRGFYIGLESLVYLSVPDKNLRGNHRVTSKSISVSGNDMSCTLGLDKRKSRIGDFLERKISLGG